MQVTIIGSGNVATVFGRMLAAGGHTIRQVYSRTATHAHSLAGELQAQAVSAIGDIEREADIYILCVTDDALPGVAAQLSLGDRLLVHTAGSVSREVLAGASSHYGVIWPMKMIRRSMQELGPVSVIIDGNTAAVIDRIRDFAGNFSDSIAVADDGRREKMHMLASVTANFPNHLYQLAAEYCAGEGIDFSVFYPIIEETAKALRQLPPARLQAGPAFRGDRKTIGKHEALLRDYPQLDRLYREITRSLLLKNGYER
ncbi:Rossmann-like and DUF2520 domain-containing protein [Sediminibacterium soli]|uniref:Rossmann-like and DUF2520 domain-containing protein n=1 Tax=Sediminibacterium soli TaxID=2698829 RepID=UPI00137A8179|nr:Rossmann-like and DUF2520 domain-containing protein [Sediminibacterium soli]NCI47081.1 DUF2520 domain-containing protein [Sediminibacterium soli]